MSMILIWLKRWYMKNFIKCKKCNGKLNPYKEFLYHWYDKYPIIGGWYHVNCGRTIPSTIKEKEGFLPF